MDVISSPVLILCGGMGTRLREETEWKPKPLVEIGGKPILWHIMKIYAAHGLNNFILCLGYKGNLIRQYFLNYHLFNSDFTIGLGWQAGVKVLDARAVEDWRVTLVETGEATMTGGRVKRAARYVEGDELLLTYGDGVCDVDIGKLLAFHRAHGKIGTVTGVRPSSRFGELVSESGRVVEFSEKPQIKEGSVNGGFFVFRKEFLELLPQDDACVLEGEPLERLSRAGELMVYKHEGFWQCMDTYRDFQLLNRLWDSGSAAWKKW